MNITSLTLYFFRTPKAWLLDNVYAVRDSMTHKLREIVQLYGLAWAVKKIIPRIVNMGSEKAYLARLTTVFAFQVGAVFELQYL